MQVPFLDADHFHSARPLPIDVRTFLNLPVPEPRPIVVSNFADHFQFYPDGDSYAEIEKFPINDPLSKFISEVLPHRFVSESVYSDYSSRHTVEGFAGSQWRICVGLVDDDDDNDGGDSVSLQQEEIEKCENVIARPIPKDDEDDDNVDGNDSSWVGIIQFEEPEMHLSNSVMRQSNECVCLEDKRAQIFLEVSEVENNLDSYSPRHQMQFPKEIQESLLQLEHIAHDFDTEEKARASKETGSAGKETNVCCHSNSFPFFEMEEMSTSIFPHANSRMDENFLLYLDSFDPLCHDKHNLPPFELEPAASLLPHPPDAFEFLSNYCLSQPCAQLEPSFLGTSSGAAIADIVDASSILNEGSLCPIVFQELEFLLTDRSLLYELFFFKLQKANGEDDDSLGWGLMEDANFKSLNELIVTREITPIDGLFKSLPVPIVRTQDNLASISASKRIEDVLAKLQSIPFSASDGIYLDWYLLEKEKCDSLSPTLCRDVLDYASDVPVGCLGDEKLLFRFVFHDDAPNAPNGEHEEPLNIGLKLNTLLNGEGREPVKEVLSVGESAKKNAEVFSKTVPCLSDLDFFLNPIKTLAREKSQQAAVAPHAYHASFPEEGELGSAFIENCENVSPPLKPEMQALVSYGDGSRVRFEEGDANAEACFIPVTVSSSTSNETNAEQNQRKTIIVVNTRNSDKEMIVSRRSTYGKILAMEKEEEGTEVVERDLHQPVDIVISCGVCLVWYDCRNIRKKATSADEASSCLPSCIEDLAATVLVLLSFTFQACVLVFEGETSFLSMVMDSSDGLCAAAASLGIDLQLFCSYSQELTDEIILRSIFQNTKLRKKMHLKMAESETIAESFLAKFPSVNPLTAHAILCSVASLIEFFESSHDRRIFAIRQYQIPDESLALFSTVCRYGEREDTKSITTDCSSSISSGHDSMKFFHLNADKIAILNLQKQDQQGDDFAGEVIDFSFLDTIPSREEDEEEEEANYLQEIEKYHREKAKTARRLSFGKSIHPDVAKKMAPSNQQKLLEEVLVQKSGRPDGLLVKEMILQDGRTGTGTATPLSRAVDSGRPRPGSPWTIEFLNRIRDSRERRRQSDTCKQKTPSVIDRFRHRGGCTSEKLRERKRQKQSSSSSSDNNGKTIFYPLQTWTTPIDKRSTQTLSFTMDNDDSQSQSRLVWSDGNAHRFSKKFRYQ